MFEKLKANKNKILSHCAVMIGAGVLSGIVATALGEQLGYGALVAYFFGVFGQRKVAGLLEKRLK